MWRGKPYVQEFLLPQKLLFRRITRTGSCGCVSEYIRVCSSDFPPPLRPCQGIGIRCTRKGRAWGGRRSGIDGFGFIGVTGRRWKRRRRERKEGGWVHKSCKGCAGWDETPAMGRRRACPRLDPRMKLTVNISNYCTTFSFERSSWLCACVVSITKLFYFIKSFFLLSCKE